MGSIILVELNFVIDLSNLDLVVRSMLSILQQNNASPSHVNVQTDTPAFLDMTGQLRIPQRPFPCFFCLCTRDESFMSAIRKSAEATTDACFCFTDKIDKPAFRMVSPCTGLKQPSTLVG